MNQTENQEVLQMDDETYKMGMAGRQLLLAAEAAKLSQTELKAGQWDQARLALAAAHAHIEAAANALSSLDAAEGEGRR